MAGQGAILADEMGLGKTLQVQLRRPKAVSANDSLLPCFHSTPLHVALRLVRIVHTEMTTLHICNDAPDPTILRLQTITMLWTLLRQGQ